jgi:hypothetical protein
MSFGWCGDWSAVVCGRGVSRVPGAIRAEKERWCPANARGRCGFNEDERVVKFAGFERMGHCFGRLSLMCTWSDKAHTNGFFIVPLSAPAIKTHATALRRSRRGWLQVVFRERRSCLAVDFTASSLLPRLRFMAPRREPRHSAVYEIARPTDTALTPRAIRSCCSCHALHRHLYRTHHPVPRQPD